LDDTKLNEQIKDSFFYDEKNRQYTLEDIPPGVNVMITTAERDITVQNEMDYRPVAFMKFNGTMSVVELNHNFQVNEQN